MDARFLRILLFLNKESWRGRIPNGSDNGSLSVFIFPDTDINRILNENEYIYKSDIKHIWIWIKKKWKPNLNIVTKINKLFFIIKKNTKCWYLIILWWTIFFSHIKFVVLLLNIFLTKINHQYNYIFNQKTPL